MHHCECRYLPLWSRDFIAIQIRWIEWKTCHATASLLKFMCKHPKDIFETKMRIQHVKTIQLDIGSCHINPKNPCSLLLIVSKSSPSYCKVTGWKWWKEHLGTYNISGDLKTEQGIRQQRDIQSESFSEHHEAEVDPAQVRRRGNTVDLVLPS